MDLCFATNNAHKLEEIRQKLGEEFKILSLEDIGFHGEIPETHDTLQGNSFEKAEYIFEKYKINCFADDTGLEVEELKGAPGVYSARYAGPQRDANDNMDLLINNLEGITNRSACFKTVITLFLNETAHQFEGIVEGSITGQKRGDAGFGYDPVFLPTGYNFTFAEMSMDDKNKISHRARALDQLVHFLKGAK